MTEEQQKQLEGAEADLLAAKRVTDLLDDPVFAGRLQALEKDYLGEFDDAESDEKRRDVWAKTKALREFMRILRGIQQSANVANAVKTRIETEEAVSRQRTTRK